MSVYTLVNTAAQVTGFNANLTPPIPSGISAGNLLLLHTGSYQGSLGTPSVSGWTPLSPGVNAQQVALFGKIAVGGDTSPTVAWGNQEGFAFIDAYAGGPATLAGIVHASADRLHSDTQDLGFPALTITAANCLVIAAGARDKTATSNGGTFSAFGSFSIRNQFSLNGASIAAVLNEWIQTTATNITAGFQTFSIADGANQQNEGYIVALLPGAGAITSTSRLSSMGVG